jgi:hypothetical protein
LENSQTTCYPQKNDFAVNDFATSPALIETPLQSPLRLARGMLFMTCFTHFAAHHFTQKIPFPPFLFEHFSDTRI